MCFSSPQPQPTPEPAPAPPAPAPLAQAVTPLTNYQNETVGQPGYNAAGQPKLLSDPSTQVKGQPGVGTAGATASGLGPM